MMEETFVSGTPRGRWEKGDATIVRNSAALPLDGRKIELRHFARWWSGKPPLSIRTEPQPKGSVCTNGGRGITEAIEAVL